MRALILTTAFLCLFVVTTAEAASTITLAWEPQPNGGLTAGYEVLYGTSPGSYESHLDAGLVTSCIVGNLTPGETYYFAVRAYSADGAVSAPSSEVVYSVAAATVSSLTLTPVTPSPTTLGTTVRFTASAAGGVAPYQYQWSVFNGAAWTVGSWTAAAAMDWTPTTQGNYTIRVGARSSGNTSGSPESTQTLPFTIAAPAPAPAAVTLTSNVPSPQRPGVTIAWSASATGGVTPYQFKWLLYDGGTLVSTSGWSTSPTWSWQPTAFGQYQVRVWVRNAGQTTNAPDATATSSFRIKPGGGK